MYRDSEMAIWFASGQGLASQCRPILRFAWPIIAVIAVLALVVWPWSNEQIQQLRTQFEQRSDIDRIAPGEFQESSDGSRVIFIDKDSLSAESASNVFVVEKRADRESITSAKSARLETKDGLRMAVLSEGQRVENSLGDDRLKLSHFEEYALRLEDASASAAENTPRSQSVTELLDNPQPPQMGELAWRIGLAVAAINLALLALGITSVNPRAGQSTSLAIALLAFVVYYNLMVVGQSWVASGKLPMIALVLLLHGGVFVLALAAMTIRHHRWHIKDLWQRRGVNA